MKKNIIIALLTVATIASLTYAFNQKEDARLSQLEARTLKIMAEQNAQEAIKQQTLANEQRIMAEEQRRQTEKALMNAIEAQRNHLPSTTLP